MNVLLQVNPWIVKIIGNILILYVEGIFAIIFWTMWLILSQNNQDKNKSMQDLRCFNNTVYWESETGFIAK